MPVYNAPIRDIRFVLHEVLSSEALTQLPGCEDVTPDLVEQVLVEGGRLCEEVLFPLNQEGDRTGCRFENGEVITPRGFRQAYQAFVDGGWNGLAAPLDYGGQGLPQTLYFAFVELMCSANLSFGMYPGLTQGACHALQLHGSPELKARFLPPLIAGTWAGTMCLTEPQCGTDLGLIRTRAVPDGAGGYKITGTKIFITAGDHDLTPNIVHLVLARLPEAPAGTRGISLFLVPKFLPADGSEEAVPGLRNRVTTTGIEHKMGIRGSSTCALAFDEAAGWLVGGPHQGMRAMFTMMNAARLAVGLQGLGMAEIAYQNARAYARERLQGRALGRPPANPAGPADPIIVHPDIRRHLMTMKAQIEAARMLALSTGLALDIQERHPDSGERTRAEDRVAVLTPILKALLTDLGVDCAHRAIQVWGGHGYITDNGIEQYLRDARITQLYEGTNGIQALDLVGRKLPQDFGRPLRAFFHPAAATLEAAAKNPALAEVTPPVAKAFARLQQVTLLIAGRGLADPNEAAAVATDYLRLFGLVALAVAWLEMIKAAHKGLASTGADDIGEHRYYAAKLATGGFFITKLLPEVHALAAAIQAGAGPVMALGAEEF